MWFTLGMLCGVALVAAVVVTAMLWERPWRDI